MRGKWDPGDDELDMHYECVSTQVRMRCVCCGLWRYVDVHGSLTAEDQLRWWDYVCARCAGVGQCDARLVRKEK